MLLKLQENNVVREGKGKPFSTDLSHKGVALTEFCGVESYISSCM